MLNVLCVCAATHVATFNDLMKGKGHRNTGKEEFRIWDIITFRSLPPITLSWIYNCLYFTSTYILGILEHQILDIRFR
jgi:hypothetical protein